MRTRTLSLVLGALAMGLLANQAVAKPGKGKGPDDRAQQDKSHPGQGKGKNKDKDKAHPGKGKDKPTPQASHIPQFDHDQRELISALFRGEDGARRLPPGLAKNLRRGKPLPPGWQKKLVPGQRIEDTIWNALTPFSHEQVPGLKHVPNTRLYYHDNRVLRVLDASRVLLDVIPIP